MQPIYRPELAHHPDDQLMAFSNDFQASGGPGFNGLSNIKLEDGMGPTMGGVKVSPLLQLSASSLY